MQTAKLWKVLSGISLSISLGCTTPIGAAISQKIPGNKSANNNNKSSGDSKSERKNEKKSEKGKASKAAELDFSAGKPQLSYQSLFTGMTLDEKSGELSFNGLALLGLPEKEKSGGDANYNGDHKLEIVLSTADRDGKTLKQVWSSDASASIRNGVASLSPSSQRVTLSQGNNYNLDLMIDGKTYPLTGFFVMKATKDKVSRYFLSEPFGAWSSLKLVEKGNEFFGVQLGYYHSLQTLDDKTSADGRDVYAKLLNEDTGQVVAAHLNTSGGLYSKRKWSALNLSFYDAENINTPYKGSKLLASDGNYSLRVRFVKDDVPVDTYIYKFSVKGGKVLARDGFDVIYDKDGYNNTDMVWIKGDKEGAVKTEGYVDTLPVKMKENIAFLIGNTGCRPPKSCALKDGDIVALSDMSLDDKTRKETILQDITCTLTLKQKDKIIAQHNWEQSCDDSGCSQLYVNLVTNPEFYTFKNQTTAFVNAMAALPSGSQKLTLVAEVAYAKKKSVIGYSNFTFASTGSNPKYTDISAKLEKRMAMTESQLNEEFVEKFGVSDPVTMVNNCKGTAWLRKSIGSDKREVRVPPGGTFQYDLNDGYLEQWNFSTLRWTSASQIFKNRYKPGGDPTKVNICQ